MAKKIIKINKKAVKKNINKPKITLKEAMRGVTKASFGPLLDWGPDVGNEIIR